MTIPWNVIDKVLEGKRLKEYEVRDLFRNYNDLLKIIGVEGDRTSGSSIILNSTMQTKMSMIEEQRICVLLRKMRNALKRLDEEWPNLFLIWEKAIIYGNHYLDIAAELDMQMKTASATKKKLSLQIKKASFLMVNYLQG